MGSCTIIHANVGSNALCIRAAIDYSIEGQVP